MTEREEIELVVRRFLYENEKEREKAIIGSLHAQREFLIGNTKWVVTGFFGLLIIFAALATYVFGSQIDDRYFDAIIGESLSETVEAKIEGSIKAQSKKSLEETEEAIRYEAQAQQIEAIEKISTAVRSEVKRILDGEVIEKIGNARDEFLGQSSQEIINGLIPTGAVVAFDRPDGCPAGWELFQAAGGRVIVGAGSHSNMDRQGTKLTSYGAFRDDPGGAIGGSEAILFRFDRGDLNRSASSQPGFLRRIKDSTEPESALRPADGRDPRDVVYNTMPPYIALHFCKRVIAGR